MKHLGDLRHKQLSHRRYISASGRALVTYMGNRIRKVLQINGIYSTTSVKIFIFVSVLAEFLSAKAYGMVSRHAPAFVCGFNLNVCLQGGQKKCNLMKTKSMLVFVLLCLFSVTSFAQLTTVEPSSKVLPAGNRAQRGDFGIYVGATSTMFRNLFDSDVDIKSLPLINFKYMMSSQMEFRIGLEMYSLTEKLSGDLNTKSFNEGTGEMVDATTAVKNKYGESNVLLYPGFAYHFSRKNFLDVYVGAEVPIGFETNRTFSSNAEAKSEFINSKSSFIIGLGAFIGLQAYIANLPLAIGVEYGLSARYDSGLKYKTVSTVDSKTQTYYSPDYASFTHLAAETGGDYKKLAANRGELGSQIRLTLTYYFK